MKREHRGGGYADDDGGRTSGSAGNGTKATLSWCPGGARGIYALRIVDVRATTGDIF